MKPRFNVIRIFRRPVPNTQGQHDDFKNTKLRNWA